MRFDVNLPGFFEIIDTNDVDTLLMLFALEHTLEKPSNKDGVETDYYKFLEETRLAMLSEDSETEKIPVLSKKVSVLPTTRSLSTILSLSTQPSLSTTASTISSNSNLSTNQSPISVLTNAGSKFTIATASTSKSAQSFLSTCTGTMPSETWIYKSSTMIPKSDGIKTLICRCIAPTVLARTLSEDQLEEAMDMMIEHNVAAGDFIIKSGVINDKFYIIEDGTFQEFVSRSPVKDAKLLTNTYKKENSFGEGSLKDDVISRVNVQAVTNGTLWSLDRSSYRMLLDSDNVKEQMNKRLLNKVTSLGRLKAPERKKALEVVVSRTFVKNSYIYRQGDPAEGVYIIESGTVALSLAASFGYNNVQLEISRVGPTGIFGETCLLSADPRPLTAFALHDLKVQFLSLTKLRSIVSYYRNE